MYLFAEIISFLTVTSEGTLYSVLFLINLNVSIFASVPNTFSLFSYSKVTPLNNEFKASSLNPDIVASTSFEASEPYTNLYVTFSLLFVKSFSIFEITTSHLGTLGLTISLLSISTNFVISLFLDP